MLGYKKQENHKNELFKPDTIKYSKAYYSKKVN